MTNQVNQYERHMAIQEAYQIHDSDEYFKARPQLECGDRRKVFYAGHIRGYQAATKASESEINALKERVAELEADLELLKPHPICDMGCMLACNTEGNAIRELQAHINELREAFLMIGSCYGDGYEVDNIARQAVSKTPAQSLAEHDNDVIERIALALENAEGEFKTLPEYVALVRGMKND